MIINFELPVLMHSRSEIFPCSRWNKKCSMVVVWVIWPLSTLVLDVLFLQKVWQSIINFLNRSKATSYYLIFRVSLVVFIANLDGGRMTNIFIASSITCRRFISRCDRRLFLSCSKATRSADCFRYLCLYGTLLRNRFLVFEV